MAKKSNKKSTKSANEVTLEATYDKDTPKKVRFKFGDYGEPISGTVYFPKGAARPERVILEIVDEDDE